MARPVPAVQNVPRWYADMPRKQADGKTAADLTMRECSPLFDALTSGYLLLLPCDVEVRYTGETLDVNWKAGIKAVETHPHEQHPGMPAISGAETDTVFKWVNHFVLETDPGYSILFTHPLNRDELPFRVFSGVVDTDRYRLAVNFPFRFRPLAVGSFIIPEGTPIAQAVPFRREVWGSTFSGYDAARIERRRFDLFKRIRHSYKSQYWVRKRYS